LQHAWDKYGEKNFTFSIIEECDRDSLDNKEISWIKELNTNNGNFGYNGTAGGGALRGKDNPFYGKKHTEETKKILSKKHKGKKLSKETINKIVESKKGKFCGENSSSPKITEAQAKEIIKLLLDKTPMIDISNYLTINYNIIKAIKQHRNWKHLTNGIEFPNIKKDKHGANNRWGVKLSQDTKTKIGDSHRGKKLSEEHKKKLKESSKHLSGEDCPNSKITQECAIKIIDMLNSHMRIVDISKELDVSRGTICAIKSGNTWKYLPRAS
jgi:hypothetical protein